MRNRTAWLLILACLLADSCGIRRIPKQSVAPEKVVRSYRLTAEADKLLEEGKDHLALLKYLEAADLNPYHEVIYNKVGIAYSKLTQYPQARRAVTRSIGLNPKYAFAYNTLGIVNLAEQNPKGAIKAFKKAISLNPNTASFTSTWAMRTWIARNSRRRAKPTVARSSLTRMRSGAGTLLSSVSLPLKKNTLNDTTRWRVFSLK